MARRVYFAFHYRDVAGFRANVVRNSWATQKDREEAGFFDASLWERTKREGDLTIKRLINAGLEYTSVTAVLIGRETFSRRWVRYEIAKSFERGNGLLGIYIHNIPDKYGDLDSAGPNPFDYLYFDIDWRQGGIWLLECTTNGWRQYEDVPSVSISSIRYDFLKATQFGQFSEVFKVYDWVLDDGYNNLGTWVEMAAQQAGR
ncbi:MAG TPA: TIR domain-containing protein [Firmicutes bacterium]|nr:TIR domain-containing protein [Candidatus Fermentithermobacillaceae bacterium]